LDESLNETIKDLTLFGNISLIEIDEDESISGREFFAVNNQIENALQNTKTLLTTSLSSVKLSVTAHDLLLIFNDIIPNSIILKRELISELKIVKTAMDQGFTNLLIINTQSGNPVGLTFFDLLIHRKTFVALSSFECFKYSNTVGKIEVPQLVINYDRNLNESQEFVLTFFSTILPKQCDHKTYDSNTININYCNDCESMKFEFNFIGLKFCMVPQTNFNILR
jgi:rRNA maturation protein Rpf1